MSFLLQVTFLTPVVASIILFFVLLFIGWLLRTRAKLSIGLFYSFFALVLSVYIWFYLAVQSGYFGNRDMELLSHWFLAVVIFIGVWVGTRIILAFIWNVYFTKYRKIQVPVLLRNLATVLILLVSILLIVRYVFLQSLSGLLVASSITAAVIAFALQDFLGALIAGIAINIHPPFQVGDWVEVAGTEGKVVDINWRATLLYTTDKTHVVFPNSQISNEQITNFYRPDKNHAMRIQVSVDDKQPPTLVKETLLNCALQAEGVVAKPAPRCRLIDFGDSRDVYELKFYIQDHLIHEVIKDNVTTAIWYTFKRLNISMPNPSRDIYIQESDNKKIKEQERQAKVEGQLRNIPIFEPLKDKHIRYLYDTGETWLFGKSENIVEQGQQGDSLYLILRGDAEAVVKVEGGSTIQVGKLSAGDFFGEKSLFTGEPRGATVRALSDLEVMEIEKIDLEQILKKTPEMLEGLSEVLAERQLINEGFFEKAKKENEVEEARKSYSNKILGGMKSFFGL